jgi:hypothetical protein
LRQRGNPASNRINIVRFVKHFIKVVDFLDGKGLFGDLDDDGEPVKDPRQAMLFYELLKNGAKDGVSLYAALME